MKVMSPLLYRTKGKSGIDVKDTNSKTNLFLIINASLIIKQRDMVSSKKCFQTLILVFPNNLKDY